MPVVCAMEATVAYLKSVLSALSAIFLALLLPSLFGLFSAFRGIGQEKATGIAVVGAGFLEALFSPIVWALAVIFAVAFFFAGRLQNTILRVLLFWIPTVVTCVFGLGLTTLYGYIFLHFRRG